MFFKRVFIRGKGLKGYFFEGRRSAGIRQRGFVSQFHEKLAEELIGEAKHMGEVEEEQLSDDALEEFIEEELDKEIDQSDKVDESVSEQMSQMGWIWDKVNSKLQEDAICFGCKKKLDLETSKPHVVEATSVDKGVIAFVMICEKCVEERAKQEKTKITK